MNPRTLRHQSGMTLVELMVGLMLGIFVATAAGQLFVGSKRSYNLNEAMARVQENGRFAMSFLSYDARMADYSVDPGAIRQADWDSITGANDTGLNNSDSITFSYEEIEGGIVVENTYAFAIQASKNGSPSLFRSRNGGNAVEVAEGIENLQILYGEDTDSDYVPDYYVDWSNVADRAQVVAIRFNITARTLSGNISSTGGKLTKEFSSAVVLRNRLP